MAFLINHLILNYRFFIFKVIIDVISFVVVLINVITIIIIGIFRIYYFYLFMELSFIFITLQLFPKLWLSPSLSAISHNYHCSSHHLYLHYHHHYYGQLYHHFIIIYCQCCSCYYYSYLHFRKFLLRHFSFNLISKKSSACVCITVIYYNENVTKECQWLTIRK